MALLAIVTSASCLHTLFRMPQCASAEGIIMVVVLCVCVSVYICLYFSNTNFSKVAKNVNTAW